MPAPEQYGPEADTLIVEPVPPIEGSGDGPAERDGGAAESNGGAAESNAGPGAPPAGVVAGSAVRTGPHEVRVQVRHRFTELDGLRGIAALVIVVFHLRRHLDDLDPPRHLDRLLSGGYLMVDLFFVLSGFVLARTMLATRTPSDVLRFSTLRARRFLPLHLTGMAIAFACVLLTWILQQNGFDNAPTRPAFTIEQQSLWGYTSAALLIQGLVGPHFAGYAAAWSLSVELWTNILLVIAIAAAPRAAHKQLVGPLALVAGAGILLAVDPRGDPSVGWPALGRGLVGLGAGMAVYWLYTVGVRRGWARPGGSTGAGAGAGDPAGPGGAAGAGARGAAGAGARGAAGAGGPGLVRWAAAGSVAGLLLLAVAMFLQRDLRALHYLPMIPVAVILVFCLAQPTTGPAHALLNSRVAQWLGSRSFALYALHGSVLTAITLACRLRGLDLNHPRVAVFIIVTTLVGALVAADLGHRFVERLWVPKRTG